MKIEHGNYQVMRACCMSGNCFECFACWNKSKRKRFVHMDGLSLETAQQVAENYRAYDATVELMPEK